MRYERAILISFIGNYLINNLVAAIVAVMGLSGNTTMQYSVYIALASIAVALFTWWYLKPAPKANGLMDGAIFGVIAFVVAVVTAFVSGISGVITQTGSLAQVASVLPNFWPFLANWSTLALLAYWVVPGALVGFFLQRGSSSGTEAPRPMI
jgi:hypothetical protein